MKYNNYDLNLKVKKNKSNINTSYENIIYINSSFNFNNSYQSEFFFKNSDWYDTYSRINNPVLNLLKKKLCKIDNINNCILFSSGMSAIFNIIICLINPNDFFISFKNLFNSTLNLFIIIFFKFNIHVNFINSYENLYINFNYKNFKFLYLESSDNPFLNILSIKNLSYITNKNKIFILLDNTLSPIILKPNNISIDIIIYSSTKFFDGKGRILGGVVSLNNIFIYKNIFIFNKLIGSVISVFNSWILLKSIKTIIIRLKNKIINCLNFLNLIKTNKYIFNLYYSGFYKKLDYYRIILQQITSPPIISIEINGMNDELKRIICWNFINRIKLIKISANLGDVNTIINISTLTTHSNLNFIDKKNININESLIRFSVGLENCVILFKILNKFI